MKNDKIDHTMDATRYLLAALEAELYGVKRSPYSDLIELLVKFEIKSAKYCDKYVLKMGSLETTLDEAIFALEKLKK